jgi:plastocyanin
MRTSIHSLLALALTSYALAQSDHAVAVGQGDIKFVPDTLTAAEGDTVTFTFYPQNHSVAQSAFSTPCEPLGGGIFSDFFPTSSGAATDTFEITITSTDPLWLYCSYPGHCQGGMVMVINPP